MPLLKALAPPVVGFALAVFVLLGASSAAAYGLTMTARGSTSSLATSSTVTVDVFLALDAADGVTFLGINVLASSDALIDYDGAASQFAPASGGAGPGAQPTDVMFTAAGPMGRPPSTILYPQQSPAFVNWPNPPAGQEQVNVNYAEPGFGTAFCGASDPCSTNVWIGTLVFEITGPIISETLSLSLSEGGAILVSGTTPIPLATVAFSAPITLTPEPTLSSLAVAALATLYVVRRLRCAADHPGSGS